MSELPWLLTPEQLKELEKRVERERIANQEKVFKDFCGGIQKSSTSVPFKQIYQDFKKKYNYNQKSYGHFYLDKMTSQWFALRWRRFALSRGIEEFHGSRHQPKGYYIQLARSLRSGETKSKPLERVYPNTRSWARAQVAQRREDDE